MEDGKKRQYIENRINHIFWEVIRYGIFMYLVSLLAYIQHDENVFRFNDFVLSQGFRQDDIDVSEPPDVYDYVADLIDSGFYAPDVERFFAEETAYFLVPPRLRQYRTRPMSYCITPTPTVRCIAKFTADTEEMVTYSRGWRPYNAYNRYLAWEYSNKSIYPSHQS